MNRSSQFALSVKTIILSLILSAAIVSCSDDNDEPARSQDDIMGVWADIEGRYMHLAEDFKAYNLYVTDKTASLLQNLKFPGPDISMNRATTSCSTCRQKASLRYIRL